MMIWLPDPETILAKARAIQPFLDESMRLLDLAVEQYQPSRLFALFSGGYDSLCTTHVVARHPLFAGVLHINTGIGIEQTHEYVRETCHAYGWKLFEYHTPIRYEDFLFNGGWPGPPLHTMVYSLLKERAIRLFMRDQKQSWHDRLILATGARRQESRRRMGTTQDIRQEDTRIWVNPLINWSKMQIHDYMEANLLPHNQVVDVLHMSGDCLCGCFAQEDEMVDLEIWYPEMAAYIHVLEVQVIARGFPWRWGQSPPAGWRALQRGQRSLPGFDLEFTPLCASCDARFARTHELVIPDEKDASPVSPRIWTVGSTPVQTIATPSGMGPQDRQGSQLVEAPDQRKKRSLLRPKADSIDLWPPQDLRLLHRICTEEDVPFELMLSLLRLEQHSFGQQKGTEEVQQNIHALFSRDWSYTSAMAAEVPTSPLQSSLASANQNPEQLMLW